MASFCAVMLMAGCWEPMVVEHAGSKHTLAEDQQVCDQELSPPKWTRYVSPAKGRLAPWQGCMQRKGRQRVAHQVLPAAGVRS